MTETTHSVRRIIGIIALAISALTFIVSLHVFFDIPGRFYYENRGWDIPTEPQQKAAYDYAHSLKLPDSVPKPVPFNFALARFKALIPGQPDVSTQYFEHLCKSESGEYIFKTVNNVEGIFQMRPRGEIGDKDIDYDRYALEEPTGVGWSNDEGTDDQVYEMYIQPMTGKYTFVERPDFSDPSKIIRAVRELNPNPPYGKQNGYSTAFRARTGLTSRGLILPWMITYKTAQQHKARYGYTWRGIKRDLDRRYSIGSGEFLIVNMENHEVLAIMRQFKQSGYNQSRNSPIWWGNARPCKMFAVNEFVIKSLKPIPQINKQYVPEELKSIYAGE